MTETQHPSRVMAVANWFLKQSWKDSSKPACDPMKLNKLAFYAHGWHLGITGEELFPEDVEAWPHGPVVRELYMEFKEFRRESITRLGRRLKLMENGALSYEVPEHNGALDLFFEKVWSVYGDKTGIQLSNMTHGKDEPWTIVAKTYKYDLAEKPPISSDIIRAAFERRIRSAAR